MYSGQASGLLSCPYLEAICPDKFPKWFLGRAGSLGRREPAGVGQGQLEREQCVALPLSPLGLRLAGRVTTHCFRWQHYCKLCMLKTTIFLSSCFDRDFSL